MREIKWEYTDVYKLQLTEDALKKPKKMSFRYMFFHLTESWVLAEKHWSKLHLRIAYGKCIKSRMNNPKHGSSVANNNSLHAIQVKYACNVLCAQAAFGSKNIYIWQNGKTQHQLCWIQIEVYTLVTCQPECIRNLFFETFYISTNCI